MNTTAPSIRTVDYMKRLNNSVNGNPRYRVFFTDGSSALTKSDSSCNYDLQNLGPVQIEITWTRAGRIETVRPV